MQRLCPPSWKHTVSHTSSKTNKERLIPNLLHFLTYSPLSLHTLASDVAVPLCHFCRSQFLGLLISCIQPSDGHLPLYDIWCKSFLVKVFYNSSLFLFIHSNSSGDPLCSQKLKLSYIIYPISTLYVCLCTWFFPHHHKIIHMFHTPQLD